MRILNRKSQLQRLRETVSDSLDVPSGSSSPAERRVGQGSEGGLMAAGGLAALTAASAGISSLRRRREGATEEA